MNKILFVIKEEEYLKKRYIFFYNLLLKYFSITTLVILKHWDKEYINSVFNSRSYLATIFWADIFDTKNLNQISSKNLVFVPMSDCIHTKKLVWWFRFRHYKTICFSKQLTNALIPHGFKIFNFLYYPKISSKLNKLPKQILDARPLNVYVNSEINEKNQIILDKLFKFQKYNIHSKIKNNTHLFLSLKKFTGLDVDFLDAISKGVVPIVPNFHNLNDYVINNKTGYLYRYDLPLFIDFSNLPDIQKNLINSVNVYSYRWQIKSKMLERIIKSKNRSPLDNNRFK